MIEFVLLALATLWPVVFIVLPPDRGSTPRERREGPRTTLYPPGPQNRLEGVQGVPDRYTTNRVAKHLSYQKGRND